MPKKRLLPPLDRRDEETVNLAHKCYAILAGNPPDLVGAVLCDLVANFLAGHMGRDREETRKWLLDLHVDTVKALVPILEKEIIARYKKMGVELPEEVLERAH